MRRANRRWKTFVGQSRTREAQAPFENVGRRRAEAALIAGRLPRVASRA